MRRVIPLLSTMALTLLVASGVALAGAIGSAGAQGLVVGPGESIQKAVNAAHPGDTIMVRGVHREDVVIRKDGIKLRGEDAVIEAPARADSPCSKTFGPEAICVLGDVNIETGKLEGQRVSDVSVSGFTIRGFKIAGQSDKDAFVIDVTDARNTTVVGNHATTGNVPGGIFTGASINTTIANNEVTGNLGRDAPGIDVDTGSRNTKIVNNVVRNYVFGMDVDETTNATITGNDLIGNSVTGIGVVDSPGTKILSNDVSRSGVVGAFMAGPKQANAKVVGNNISGGPFGIYVADTKGGGSIAGNTVRNNCAGMFFDASPAQPLGGFEVKANTVENNTRSCRVGQFDRDFSGIGIALLGATDMEVMGNQISGNVPSGPTPVSGGVVVSTDPYGRSNTPKPMNNSVTGNHFGRNKPDNFWDESGSGNRFVGNLCDTSVPSSLCN
jgi:parallel beta-helix repeat protein